MSSLNSRFSFPLETWSPRASPTRLQCSSGHHTPPEAHGDVGVVEGRGHSQFHFSRTLRTPLSYLAFLPTFCPYFRISFTHSPSDTGLQILPMALTLASSHFAHFIGLLYACGFNYNPHPEYLNLYQKPKPSVQFRATYPVVDLPSGECKAVCPQWDSPSSLLKWSVFFPVLSFCKRPVLPPSCID